MSLVKYLGSALGKPSIADALRAGGWKMFIDGNLAETLVGWGPGGELVGVDQFGNKYFTKSGEEQAGRTRWVVYAKYDHWRTQDPTAIPTEWHGWLHSITDENPTNTEFKRPIYYAEAKGHPTASPARHQPKGAWENPERRTWKKYQAWQPPSA